MVIDLVSCRKVVISDRKYLFETESCIVKFGTRLDNSNFVDFLQKDFGIKHDADSPEILVCELNFRQLAKKSRATFDTFMAGFTNVPCFMPGHVCTHQRLR